MDPYPWEDEVLPDEQNRKNVRRKLRRQVVERMVTYVLLNPSTITVALDYTSGGLRCDLPRFPPMVDITRYLPPDKVPFKDAPPLGTKAACRYPDENPDELIVDMFGVIKNCPLKSTEELREHVQATKDSFMALEIPGWIDGIETERPRGEPEGLHLSTDQLPIYNEYRRAQEILEKRMELEGNGMALSVKLDLERTTNKFMLEAIDLLRRPESEKRTSHESSEEEEGPVRKKSCDEVSRKELERYQPLQSMPSPGSVTAMTDAEKLKEVVLQQQQLIRVLCDQIETGDKTHKDAVDRLLKREYRIEIDRQHCYRQ